MRVLTRIARSAHGQTIQPAAHGQDVIGQLSILVPVLNERDRLGPCLDGLIATGDEVAEIVVVDGGSTDGTRELVETYRKRESRLRFVDASPIPDGWNGKAWGLHVGADASDPRVAWLLTIDADVRPRADLPRALLAHADATRLDVLSVATLQELSDRGEGLLHPAMLTTLVYRFGIPGGRYRRVSDVQANGQCFLVRRTALQRVGGFASVSDEICEDVSLARRLVAHGFEVGFFEAAGLVSVDMYPDWRATWRDWPRSLPLRDRYSGLAGWIGLLEVLLVQALPLPLLGLLQTHRTPRRWITLLNLILLMTRLGVLAGTARAYARRPSTYWLSPLADLPVALRLIASALRRRHTWRGRVLTRGGGA